MATHFIGDTHLGHGKILVFEKEARPFSSVEEMNETIIERWNSVVRPNDLVWHLGDVLFGSENFSLLARLNGKKRLVMGNHDHHPTALYLEHFEGVYGAVKEYGMIYTHIPIHPNQFYRFKANIHGHLHSDQLEDKRYVNVSAEQNNLTPISLEEIMERLK